MAEDFVIEMLHITKEFPGIKANDDITLQLRKGFRRTLIYSVVFSFIDRLSGLLLSYYIDAAPGGVTALTSVAMLLLVIAYKECVFSLQEKRRRP